MQGLTLEVWAVPAVVFGVAILYMASIRPVIGGTKVVFGPEAA